MLINWSSAAPTVLAAFLASAVEFVEALTVVLAVGTVRGWKGALSGSGFALGVLLILIASLGPAMAAFPIDAVQLIVGTLLLLFGMRWIRKAILRAAGIIPLHDEEATYAQTSAALRRLGGIGGGWDKVGFAAAFKITMLEGIEVVFIVIAIGAGGSGLLLPASLGALAALIVVIALGLVVHKPLAKVPENSFKFVVGVLLSAFGAFWVGEGMGFSWPGGDWSVLGLIAGFFLTALFTVALCRFLAARRPAMS